MNIKKLKVLKKSDHVSIVFGEWFDRANGNTYYDAEIRINNKRHGVRWKYGYNAGDAQSITEALQAAGYRLRENKADRFSAINRIHTSVMTKLKRDLIKESY